MINYDLLSLLERILGKSRKTSGSNYSFFSPFISHHKTKLEIDLGINPSGFNFWHCWVSNEKGRTIHSLFKRLKLNKAYFDQLDKILGSKPLFKYGVTKEKFDTLKLPPEFTKLTDYPFQKDISTKIQLRQAINYLKNRGLTATDMFRYNIGYCIDGAYNGRVIIPSYDENLQLNFFVSRTIFDDVEFKYKNPRVSKDIVGFESMINWNEPVTIVEGVFDAISARYNAIPLFGKTISKSLATKLLIRRPPMVRVALDNDALSDSIKICSYLDSNGVNVSLIKMDGKDVNQIGFENFDSILETSKKIDSFDLIKERILL